MGASIFVAMQRLGVRRLEVLTTGRLDVDESVAVVATRSSVAKGSVGGEGSFSVFHGCHCVRRCMCF